MSTKMKDKMIRPEKRWVGGVCASLGFRFGLDPLICRVAFILLSVTLIFPIAIYLVLWLSIPNYRSTLNNEQKNKLQNLGGILGAILGAAIGFYAPIMVFGFMNGLILLFTSIMGLCVGTIFGIAFGRYISEKKHPPLENLQKHRAMQQTNSNKPINHVRACNSYSCSVACVLSVCYDNNILIKSSEDDKQIVEDPAYFGDFPHWEPGHWDYKPGILNESGIITLAKKLGLISNGDWENIKTTSIQQLKEKYNDDRTIGILVLTNKNDLGTPSKHSYKLSSISETHIVLMDPSTHNKNQEMPFSYHEFLKMEPDAMVFIKQRNDRN